MRRRLVLALALALLPALPGSPALADHTLEHKQRQNAAALAEQQADLHETSQAVVRALASLRRVQLRLPRAQAAYAAANGQLASARAHHDQLRHELRGAEAAARSGERATQAAAAELQRSRDAIGAMARAAYMRGRTTLVALVLEADTPADALERYHYLKAGFRNQNEGLRRFANLRAELAARTADLEQRRSRVAVRQREAATALARVTELAARAESAYADIQRLASERKSSLRIAERERAAEARRYAQLVAESARLARLLREQSRGSGRIGRGGLLWPTPGEITSRYGWRTHPIYGYRRFHAGVDIGAPSGQAIVAVKSGVVVHAGPMGSYGNIVVIDHGDGFSTAYAHQSRVASREGQQVARGQVIGYVGSTGASTGPHCHYETRVNGDPVDPMRYY